MGTTTRRLTLAACLLLIATEPGGSQPLDEPLTLVSLEGRRLLPTVAFDGRRMVDLRQLTGPFGLTVPENQQPDRLTLLRGEQVMAAAL